MMISLGAKPNRPKVLTTKILANTPRIILPVIPKDIFGLKTPNNTAPNIPKSILTKERIVSVMLMSVIHIVYFTRC